MNFLWSCQFLANTSDILCCVNAFVHAGRKEGVKGISNFSNGVIAMLPRQKANNNLDLFKTDYSASTLFSAVFSAVFSNGHLCDVIKACADSRRNMGNNIC